jgi:hypothetical protein
MKTIFSLLFSGFIFLSLFSCKKEAGVGGTSSIKGKVYANYYDKYFYTLAKSSYAGDIDVYIIYGNNSTYGSRQKTSYDGTYEFKYLENGAYKIYAYSRDSTGKYKNAANQYAPKVAIVESVEITKRNQTINVPDIVVFQ